MSGKSYLCKDPVSKHSPTHASGSCGYSMECGAGVGRGGTQFSLEHTSPQPLPSVSMALPACVPLPGLCCVSLSCVPKHSPHGGRAAGKPPAPWASAPADPASGAAGEPAVLGGWGWGWRWGEPGLLSDGKTPALLWLRGSRSHRAGSVWAAALPWPDQEEPDRRAGLLSRSHSCHGFRATAPSTEDRKLCECWASPRHPGGKGLWDATLALGGPQRPASGPG